mmetsp:Transcript_39914/g.55490  ORF Transcript_39914/g.55490 Transcript_39914/m.55490 type:complete len:212 (+) Transcript_39914:374-1009(+)
MVQSPQSPMGRSTRSFSTSPRKRSRAPRVWTPDKPFDSSSSVKELTTRIYSTTDDPHLSPMYRRRCKELEKKSASFAEQRDRLDELNIERRMQETDHRGGQLTRMYESRPELYERTWGLLPDQRAYYPSTLSAGGSELCPIKRTQQIDPPLDHVDNQSLLAHPHWGSQTFNSSKDIFRLSMNKSFNTTMSTSSSVTLRKHLCSPHQVTVDI